MFPNEDRELQKQERRLRRLAKEQGLLLRKLRNREWFSNRYLVVDAVTNGAMVQEPYLTLDQVEDFLN